MKFELTLDENDYLNQMLFSASKSKLIRKRRMTNRIIIPVIFLALSGIFFYTGNQFLCWAYLITAMAAAVAYPFYQKSRYRKFYLKHIKSDFEGRINKTCELEFQDDILYIKDYLGESKINLSELECIYETEAYFFFKFKTGDFLVIPKRQVQLDDFIAVTNKVIVKHQVDFQQELNWQWS